MVITITTTKSKHADDNRTTAISQQFIPSPELINAISGVSSVLSHVNTRSSTRVFMHSQTFTYLPISQSLSPLQAYVLGFQTYSSSHSRCLIAFYTHNDTYHCSIFVLSYILYHQTHICSQVINCNVISNISQTLWI